MNKLLIVQFLTAAMVVLMCIPGFAENKTLSLSECLDIAVKNQTDIITSTNNVKAAKNRVIQQQSQYYPQVTIQNNTFATGDSGVLSRSTTGTALSINQKIWDGGLREANLANSRYNYDASKSSLQRIRQTVVYNVSRAYYEILRAKHLEEVSRANVLYNEALKQQIELQSQIGEAAKVDVLPVDAQLANARVSLLSSQKDVRNAIINLQIAMGLTPTTGFDVSDITESPSFVLDNTDTYFNSAVTSRPDIKLADFQAKAASASVKAARIPLYPQPSINAGYSKSISGGYGQTGGQIIGSISFDVFNGGANKAALDEAKANLANAEENIKEAKRQIRAEIEQAVLNIDDASARLQATQISLESSQKNLEVQKERYSQGLAITLDLLDAEVKLVESQSSQVQAKYDYYDAIAQLDYAIGRYGENNGK